MKRTLARVASIVLPTLVAVSCGGNSAPTRPSTSAPTAAIVVSSFPVQTAPVHASWACVTQGTGCPARLTVAGQAAAATAPGAPPNLTGSVSGTTVTLTWLVPTSADPATSYVIEAGSAPGTANLANFDTGSTATSLTATGVGAGTYFVRVRAKNSAGSSPASNEVTLTVSGGPCAAPGAPGGLTATVTGSSVTLTWTGGAGASSYVLEAGSASGAANLANADVGSATSFSTSGVGAGTYFVRVRTKNVCGTSAASNEVTIVVGSTAINVTGRWVGLAPDGFIISDPDSCEAEQDMQFDLVQTGTALSGTATSRTRKLTPGKTCGVIGFLATTPITGAVNGSAITLTAPGEKGRPPVTFTGTVSGTRMSGSVVGYAATFALTKQ